MPDYDASTYGDRIAKVYDEWFAVPSDADDAVAFLSDLGGSGPVLELGIGTGRIALPLAQRGHRVHGVDASEAMVQRLRAKTGGTEIPVTIGDFADLDVEGDFSLVYVVLIASSPCSRRRIRYGVSRTSPGGCGKVACS